MAALIDATTGYGTPNLGDWTDTTPQMGSSDSGTNISLYVFVPFTSVSLIQGRLIDTGTGGGGGATKESWGIIGQ
jgi:hypothetical protein